MNLDFPWLPEVYMKVENILDLLCQIKCFSLSICLICRKVDLKKKINKNE